jgi:4-carboxymuconolactone decarboxylase
MGNFSVTAPFVVLAQRRVKPGQLDAFLEADDALMQDASGADGFGEIHVVQTIEDDHFVTHFEIWRDQAAHDAYVMDDTHADFEERIAELVEHVEDPKHYGVFRSYYPEGQERKEGEDLSPNLVNEATREQRIAPASQDDLSDDARTLLSSLPDLTFFRLVARTGPAFRPFMSLADKILNHGAIDPRLREIAILAIAHLEGSTYEHVQHGEVARRAGVTDAQIDVIGEGDFEAPILNDDERIVLHFVESWWRRGIVEEAPFAAMMDRFGEDQTTELLLICGFYLMAARMMTNAGLPPEEPPSEQLETGDA